MLQLLDLNKHKIAGLTEYKDLCIESVLKTGDKTLSFLYCKNSKHYFDIVEEAYIRTKEAEFVIKEKNIQNDYTTFICKLNVEELEGHTFDRFESKEQTITDALNLAIVNTSWTVAKNTITKKRTVRKTNCSAWEIIQDIKKTYRVEIEFDTLNKQIKVYECLGSDKGTYFIDSLNLKSVNIQSNSYDFYTRIIPVGKDGLTIESVNNGKNYVENYQYSKKIKTLIWKDERYTIKENLKADAIAKLIDISKPYKAYKVEILNLAELNNEYKNVLDYHLGDTITLISKDNKIKEKQRIVKTKIYPEDHFKDSCELSNTVLSFEDIQKQFQEAAETIDNVTTDNGTIDGSTIDSIKTNQIEDFEANVIKVAKLKAVLAEIENLHANKADIQNLNAVVAKIGTLEATKASITQLDAVNAVIQKIKAGKADITDLNAAVAKISVLESKAATIDNLVSQKADIKDLNALNANISNALIKKATIAQLEAIETKTNKLIATKADITDLNATNANINSIKADTADIKTLINGNLSSENIQTGGIASDKLTISDGFIKDAMIANVSASKLAAGTIDASKINVVNLNADNLTVGKINGHLLKDGSISKLAIGNGAIDNSKVAPGANIEASKININSVVTAINAGSTLLTANKIAIDSDKGTLDLAFKSLNTSLDANKKATESNSTAINVVQGKINASIENSKILEGKQKTLEDNYNRTVSTVDSLKNTIGSHKTLIDSATGKITSVEIKANTLEKDLSGLTQAITDTKKVIENNKTSLESKNAELKANIDKVSSSLSSVSNTVDKNNKVLASKTNTLEQTLSGLTQTVSSNKAAADEKITSVENVTHELNAGLSGLTSKLDTLKSSTDGINKTVINQSSAINQLQDSIKLKVDSSTFNKSTETINSNLNKAKADAVLESIKAAGLDASNKANNALKDAKNYTNTEITTVNTHLNKVNTEIDLLKDQISTKVSQSDIDKSIESVEDKIKITTDKIATVESTLIQKTNTISAGVKDLTSTTQIITNNINDLNKDLNNKIKSNLDDSKKFTTDKANEIFKNANAHADSVAANKATEALNNAKTYINSEIKTINTKVCNAESGINILKDQINTKVSQSDIDKSIKVIEDKIKITDSNISNISNELTQAKDGIEAKINSVNSKTQSIESSLNGKATKQDVTNVDSKVTTLTANLNSITQRVTNSESKTHTLETSLNGKASKQEVTAVNSKVASIETNINGITQRVGNSESKINSLNGKVAGAVTTEQFTEFKQDTENFKWTVQQKTNLSNIIPNGSFFGGDRGWLHDGNEFWSGPYSGYGFKGRMTAAIKNKTAYNNPERYLQTHKAYKVKKNTTYTISFHYACEMNIESMEAYVILSDNEAGNYAQPIKILEKPGGTQSDPNNEIPFTYKFNTGNHEWVWIRFDNNGMKAGTNWDQYCWLYISEVAIYEGDVGNVKWTPKGGEVYSSNYQMDGLGFKGVFDDGSYAYMGKEGFEWFNAGTGHSYHALAYVTSFDIPAGNPGKAYIKLPAEFTKRKNSLKWTVATRGYYYSTTGDFFPFHVHCTGVRDYIENGLVVCEVQGHCRIQNAQNSNDVQMRPLTAMLIAIA